MQAAPAVWDPNKGLGFFSPSYDVMDGFCGIMCLQKEFDTDLGHMGVCIRLYSLELDLRLDMLPRGVKPKAEPPVHPEP